MGLAIGRWAVGHWRFARAMPRGLSRYVLALACLAASHSSFADHSARAQLIGGSSFSPEQNTFQVQDSPNKLAAATAALNQCRAANPVQNTETGFCELTHSDARPVTTSMDLRGGQSEDPHPLFLWHLTSDTASIYLGGSIHILKPGLYPLAPQYQAAFDHSDIFVTEVDTAALTPQAMQYQLTRFGVLADDQRLSTVLPAEVYRALVDAGSDFGLPMNALEKFKPAYVTQQLAVMALMSVGYTPEQGMERYFQNQLGSRRTLGLETIEFQLDLLLNQPLPVQIEMTRETLSQMDEFEPLTAELIRAWLHGDDAVFEQAFAAQSGSSAAAEAFLVKLLDERNVHMVAQIQEYLRTQDNYFVLIGAAHFLGEQGIIALLNQRGIKTQRIYSHEAIPHPQQR